MEPAKCINEKPEEVAEHVKNYVLKGKNGYTPLLFFFNNIAPATPAANVHAAVAAANIYGAPGADENTPFVMPEFISFKEFVLNKMENNTEGYKFDWLKKSSLLS